MWKFLFLISLALLSLLSSIGVAAAYSRVNAQPIASLFPERVIASLGELELSAANPALVQSRTAPTTSELLRQSWTAYKQRFIQADGRVIDREANDRTVSEGQAYAMLRSVLANDPEMFALTLRWAEQNLQRRDGNELRDSLWAWKWGQNDQGEWGILDGNFASDADIDAATALILAARRWNRPEYLTLAQAKLKDIWNDSTIVVMPGGIRSGTARHLLPGPIASFQPQPNQVILNPSYAAPYAFRMFAQVDSERDWMSLVNSSYQLLEDSAALSAAKLPSDWVVLNLTTGAFEPVAEGSNLRSIYSFDAFRVWWRMALDAVWFEEPRAREYLRQHLSQLQQQWKSNRRIPARIDLAGNPIVSYEATSQYAMLYPAMRLIDPAMADEIRSQKLLPTYQNGIWDNDSAYYVQNLAWFGLFPNREVAASWLHDR
ncbi:glycosyl hydrolase family 8 [Leptolyngbya sp. FACHB-711]|uniref:glycosyl hydrolase family 8 n=1 Tax=unclassified Leptolyngbya TaxID=2650499 RepID=UPI0016833944|nr:glycosyl hydrolase family 8 [Leptolyngbya sp. FACHB-711]MBD1850233.1 glycosyl hydrolase [Cyanobacteria bacterium FACHB-502]MBD2024483.1 glycosyl hydrolase [Leptolyngbya sp. FACHB-711]